MRQWNEVANLGLTKKGWCYFSYLECPIGLKHILARERVKSSLDDMVNYSKL